MTPEEKKEIIDMIQFHIGMSNRIREEKEIEKEIGRTATIWTIFLSGLAGFTAGCILVAVVLK